MATTTSAPPVGRERSNRLLLLLAVVAAGVAGILVFAALRASGGSDTSSPGSGQVAVVVAARDLSADTRLSGDDLEVKNLNKGDAISSGFSDKSAVLGSTLRYPVVKGQQISSGNIGENQDKKNQSITLTIPDGMVAIGVKATEVTATGGNLRAGDRVNVIAVFDEGNGNNASGRAETVLQNVLVLAVAQDTLEAVPPGATPEPGQERGSRGGSQDAVPTAKSVTLAVTPQDSQVLAVTDKIATIYLVARPSAEFSATPIPLNQSSLLPPGIIATAQP